MGDDLAPQLRFPMLLRKRQIVKKRLILDHYRCGRIILLKLLRIVLLISAQKRAVCIAFKRMRQFLGLQPFPMRIYDVEKQLLRALAIICNQHEIGEARKAQDPRQGFSSCGLENVNSGYSTSHDITFSSCRLEKVQPPRKLFLMLIVQGGKRIRRARNDERLRPDRLVLDLYKCGGTDGCGGTGNAINAPFTTDYPQGLSPLFLIAICDRASKGKYHDETPTVYKTPSLPLQPMLRELQPPASDAAKQDVSPL